MPLNRVYYKAKIVELLVEETLKNEKQFDNLRIDVRAYSNGRETGFSFRITTPCQVTVFVAEYKNSDDIAVTRSTSDEWSLVTEKESICNRKLFNPDAYQEAANHVIDQLEYALALSKLTEKSNGQE